MEEEQKGIVEMGGVQHEVRLSLLPDCKIGDYLIVHAGYAIEKLDQKEANERLKLFKELEEIKLKEKEKPEPQ